MSNQENCFDPLSEALTEKARAIREQESIPAEDVTDIAELLRVLAKMVSGKTVAEAFGSPGDWGYSSPIGKALYAAYRTQADNSSKENSIG